MRILSHDFRKWAAAVEVQSLDDLWHLSQVIDSGDRVKARTIRKIKLGREKGEERKTAFVKKHVTITVEVENMEFHKYSNILRLSGRVAEGTEDIPVGVYHTINVEEGAKLKIIKNHWLKFQIEKLKEAASEKELKILVCLFDRDSAFFALLKQQGYKKLSEFSGDVQKKRSAETLRGENFYKRVISAMEEYVKTHKIEYVILASPAFWKEELLKEIKDGELKGKIIPAGCSSVGINGMEELLKRPELKEVLKHERLAKETELIEQLLAEIGRSGKAAYGLEEVESAAYAGAVNIIVITDKTLHKFRVDNSFQRLEDAIKAAERAKGKVFIIDSDNAPGKKLEGLGGIGALLRYRLG